MFLNLLFQSPVMFLLVAVALILSLSIHEFAHAYVADKLGDPTARYLGRVTLNPLAHLDPVGTMLLLFLGFGWGKPVPFNADNLANPKRDSALISFAGPAANFILALLFAMLFHAIPSDLAAISAIKSFAYLAVFYNLFLGLFNLVPIHPLDGFKVVNGFLSYNLSIQWLQMAPYGMFFLLILVMTRSLSMFLNPIVDLFMRILGLPL